MTLLKEDLTIVGLSIQTTNENNQSMNDIGQLWQEFATHPILGEFLQKGAPAYCVYDQYESNEKGKYRVTLGFQDLKDKDNFSVATIKAGSYKNFPVEKISPEAIGSAWQKIWEDKDLKRSFMTDFEVYHKDHMIISIGLDD